LFIAGDMFNSKIDKSKLAQLLSEIVQDFNKLSLTQQSTGSCHEQINSGDNENTQNEVNRQGTANVNSEPTNWDVK